jgi:PAS domain-containing protein
MSRDLSRLFAEIAQDATEFSEPVLAHLCRMASLEASTTEVPLQHRQQKIIGIWDWDVPNDRNHMDLNCARAFGATPEQGRKGMPNDMLFKAIHPQDLATSLEAVSASLRIGGVFEAEYRIVTEGRERWVLAKGFCTLDKSMRPERFPGVVMEVSTHSVEHHSPSG